MDLAIDIGNNYTKLAIFENGKLLYSNAWRKFKKENLKILYKKYPFDRAILADVSGETFEAEQFIRKHAQYIKLTHSTPIPITNRYKTPNTLGLDRIAAVAGARAMHPKGNLLVIDAGTCITYEFLNSKDEYFGGGISPGLQIRFKSLKRYTGKLPLLEKQDVDYLIGGSTDESILSGVINGTAAEINGIIDRYKEEFPKLKVVLTGGDGRFFESYMKSGIFVAPNLVLYGLHKILLHNVPSLR